MSNVSHNVVIDFFAFGGIPLLISYFAVLIFVLISVAKVMLRSKSYNWIFVSLASIWAGYQVQSIVSINQIGLAIWGWLFSGLIIAFEVATRGQEVPKESQGKKRHSTSPVTPGLVAGVGMVIGLTIGLPPFLADSKWATATRQRNAAVVESALSPNLFNPANSQKYGTAVQLFADSSLGEQALRFARAAVQFNPESFDAWFQLYTLSISTPEEKSIAVKNLKRLDPLNPDVTSIQ